MAQTVGAEEACNKIESELLFWGSLFVDNILLVYSYFNIMSPWLFEPEESIQYYD